VTATLGRDAIASPPAPAGGATIAPRAHLRERLLSLDVFRGLTIAGMLLVNNPGSWSAIYPPLEHADWNGWTPTDLIFPFFIFIVGVTTHLSLLSRRRRGATDREITRQILKRGGLIVLCGLLLSGFPYHEMVIHLPFGAVFDSARSHLGPGHWRLTGVLQRIGVVYICAALLTMRTSVKQQVLIVAALLYGYWFAMTLIPVPGHGIGALMLGQKDATLAAWLDRAVFGTNHLWAGSRTWDPEGILSTVPAIGTCMLGVIAGRWIVSDKPLLERIAGLFAAGAIGMMAGLMWNWSFPINKNLWTSSYVVFTAGLACVVLATCMWLIDVHGWSWWTKPFVLFGVNPLAAFVGEGIFSRLIYTLIRVPRGGELVPLEAAIYQSAFASWLAPRNASLLFAVCYVALFLWLMRELYRRDILIKV
jgi:predicted acyltransferase